MGQDLRGFNAEITKSVRCEYWHYLPREYGRDDRRWPLLLFLHGKGERIAHLPVWLFHGEKDPIVPLYESERMVEALQKVGGKHVLI